LSWPAALLTRRRRVMALFVAAELTLAMAIPFLAIAGYHTLLDSRAGRFVEEPTENEPGWRALVDPTPVTAVVEQEAGITTGIVVLAGHLDDPPGGTVVVVPGTLQIDGVPLAAFAPDDAVAELSRVLRLRIGPVEVVDEDRWPDVLGDTRYLLANPDPVVDDRGRPLLRVGEIEVGAGDAAAFLGRPAPDSDPITLLFRRQLFWSAVVADPPAGRDPLARAIGEISGPSSQVVILPLVDVVPDPELDPVAAEALIREVVPIPSGANPGDRLQVRVIDRTGTIDLEAVAAAVASTGSEVVEIGNAVEFDGGPTHLVVPVGLDDPGISELAMLTGATTVLDNDVDADAVVTLLVGSDYAFGR